MGAEENADLVRRGYAAFSSGDIATLSGMFAENAVWNVPGDSPLSGPKEGRDAILAFFGETMTLTGGTFKVTLDDVIAGETHTVALHHTHGERNGKVLDQKAANVFRILDGQVVEVSEYSDAGGVGDAFWA
jgi:ketosteroid isomerase-like protein